MLQAGIEHPSADLISGSLHLGGLAQSYAAKQEASRRVAASTTGVSIVNEIRVAHGGSADSVSAAVIAAGLAASADGRLPQVAVNVRDGVVHLYGAVHRPEDRRRIEDLTWQQPGVSDVRSHLVVDCDDETNAGISTLLASYATRSLNVPPGQVRVSYRHGVAELTGTVASNAQAEAIADLLRWHDHVEEVVNRLRVVSPGHLGQRASMPA